MSARLPLLVWGAGGHARVVHEIVSLLGTYEPSGFIDDIHVDRHGQTFMGCPIYSGSAFLPELLRRGIRHAIVAIGDNGARLAKAEILRSHGFDLPVLMHPRSIVAGTARIDAGTVVAAGAVVGAECQIGPNCLLNTSSSVDHESALGEGVQVCPGAHVAGRVRIGRLTWLGIGAVVSDNVTIGSECVVGAGSVVLEDIPARTLAFGTPAKVVRSIG
jgi:acetyltransferase EpsM